MASDAERPMVNVYESNDAGDEELVYRPMNDEEYEIWLAHEPIPVDERAANPILAAVEAMDPDERAALRGLLE